MEKGERQETKGTGEGSRNDQTSLEEERDWELQGNTMLS